MRIEVLLNTDWVWQYPGLSMGSPSGPCRRGTAARGIHPAAAAFRSSAGVSVVLIPVPLPVVAGILGTVPAGVAVSPHVLAASRPVAATLSSAAAAPLLPTLASRGPDRASVILRAVLPPSLFLGPVFLARG